MSIPQSVVVGLAGEKLSRVITGTKEVNAGRSWFVTGVGATALVVVPVEIAAATVSFICSRFD